MQTQWRVGNAGAIGLDYAGVRAFLDEQGLAPDVRKDAFDGIQACESARLEVWQDQREAAETRREADDLRRDLASRTGR